jgi:hypothetical protein
MIDAKERLQEMLLLYDVQFREGGDCVEKVGASVQVEVSFEERKAIGAQRAVDSAMQAAITICLMSIVDKIKTWLDPKIGQTIYLWAPDEWTWCHDRQFVWEPVRMTVQADMYDRRLVMEVMAGI